MSYSSTATIVPSVRAAELDRKRRQIHARVDLLTAKQLDEIEQALDRLDVAVTRKLPYDER